MYIVTSITDENNNMMSDGRSISAMDAARSHSMGPNSPAKALCLMIDTLRVRRTVVLATRKLVMIISRKLGSVDIYPRTLHGPNPSELPWFSVV